MCMFFTLAQYIVYVNIYYKDFYVYKTVAYIHPVLYHIYRHLKTTTSARLVVFLWFYLQQSTCCDDGRLLPLL